MNHSTTVKLEHQETGKQKLKLYNNRKKNLTCTNISRPERISSVLAYDTEQIISWAIVVTSDQIYHPSLSKQTACSAARAIIFFNLQMLRITRKRNLRTYTDIVAPDQPAHYCSLTWKQHRQLIVFCKIDSRWLINGKRSAQIKMRGHVYIWTPFFRVTLRKLSSVLI